MNCQLVADKCHQGSFHKLYESKSSVIPSVSVNVNKYSSSVRVGDRGIKVSSSRSSGREESTVFCWRKTFFCGLISSGPALLSTSALHLWYGALWGSTALTQFWGIFSGVSKNGLGVVSWGCCRFVGETSFIGDEWFPWSSGQR